MPVVSCTKNGRPGFKWGPQGFCYTFTPGNAESRRRARALAAAQGRAIEAARRQRGDAAARIIIPPRGIERDYRKVLVKRVERMSAKLRKRLNLRADGAEEDAAAAETAVRATERAWTAEFPPEDSSESLLRIAGQVDGFTTKRTVTAVERVVAIDPSAAGELGDLHAVWARQNVELITSLDAKHFDDVAKAVGDAVREGKSTRDVAKALQDRVGITKRRAGLIARDQIGTLNAQITRSRQTELGIAKFRWSDSGDDRVRELHEELDGQVFDWATGHATEGRPGEPINCILPGQSVAGSFVAGVRSWYDGQVIELQTASGRRLRLTVNHPVPTARGWVPAKELRHGDQVLGYCGGVAPGDAVDPSDRPAPIEQVFRALAVHLGVTRRLLRAEDLHGDATFVQGHVDVADPARLLLNHADASGAKRVGDLLLPRSDARQVGHVASGGLGHLGLGAHPAASGGPRSTALPLDGIAALCLDSAPLGAFSIRPSAKCDTGRSQLQRDAGSLHAQPFGQGLDRFAANVGRDEFRGRWEQVGRFPALHVAPTPDLNTALAHVPSQGLSLHPDLFAQLAGGFPGLVAGDEIVEIRNHHFAGHVYDLQSTTGLMVVEGIGISNCRCTAEPVFE